MHEGPWPGPLEVIWEDEAGLVVVKPAGQLSVPGRGELATGSLAQQVQCRWPQARVVHRLDMATSGLLMFAQGAAWQRHFNHLFTTRQVDKHYTAVVHGRLGDAVGSAGQIDLPLIADWPNRPKQKVDRLHGKPSLTQWQVLAHDPAGQWTRLALRPVTGRSHQLRVHLLALGHPIVGDALYVPERPAPRLMLHATRLAFPDPHREGTVSVTSPCPF